jgi:hypothetical protein
LHRDAGGAVYRLNRVDPIAGEPAPTLQQFDKAIGVHPTAAEEFVTMRTPVKR